jgi:hypothetical protein
MSTRPCTTPRIKRFWGEPLDRTTMEKVAFASAMMTTPFFALFGWTWFYLSALMGLFSIMNYIFSVTLRIIGLWKERRFGWWLLGGLWAAIYNLLLLPTKVVKNIMVFNREQAERALPTLIAEWVSAWHDQQRSPTVARKNRVQSRRDREAEQRRNLWGR